MTPDTCPDCGRAKGTSFASASDAVRCDLGAIESLFPGLKTDEAIDLLERNYQSRAQCLRDLRDVLKGDSK
jgi:hypothetical protein